MASMAKRRVILIGAAVALLLIGVIVWLFVSGRLAIVLRDSNGRYASTAQVCGADIVETYNSVTNYEMRDGTEDRATIDSKGLKDLADKIKQRGGYESDPTCQTMLFWSAIESKHPEDARRAAAAVKDLSNRGAYPSNNLRANAPLFTYDSTIEYLLKNNESK